MRPPVLNKTDFYRRFFNSEFGNHGLMWESLEEYQDSRFADCVVFRTKIPGGRCQYDVLPQDAPRLWGEFIKSYGLGNVSIHAAMPVEAVLLNAEVTRSPGGLHVFGATVQAHMRVGLATAGQHLNGLAADHLLRRLMLPTDYDWIMNLLDEYPGHVIETTALDRPWGWVPGAQSVVWEVRNY